MSETANTGLKEAVERVTAAMSAPWLGFGTDAVTVEAADLRLILSALPPVVEAPGDREGELTRSDLAKIALAAWVGVRPDQLPPEKMWIEHPNHESRLAWDRVVTAIQEASQGSVTATRSALPADTVRSEGGDP